MHVAPALFTLAAILTSGVAGSSVDIAYAGSLVTPMERAVGPAFASACSCTYHGEGKGSVALARLIEAGLRNPDVFISADPRLLDELMHPKGHAPFIAWYARFARARLVIGYSTKSRFAPLFEQAAQGKVSLATVLKTGRLRIGRTDPKLDPKGSLTLLAMQRLARQFGDPALTRLVEASADSPQIFPEEDLLVRLESGDLDVAFLYSTESQSRGIPALELPSQSAVNVEYAITVLDRAANKRGAAAFVHFLIAGPGKAALQQAGLSFIKPVIGGDVRAATAVLKGTPGTRPR